MVSNRCEMTLVDFAGFEIVECEGRLLKGDVVPAGVEDEQKEEEG